MNGHTCGQGLALPFKSPPRTSPFLDSPASLHVCILCCCFDGHLARVRDFSWLGFLWEKWNEQRYLKREQGSSFCLTYVSQKFYSERRTEKLLLPTANHGFFPHGSVILQLNILAQNRGIGTEAGQREWATEAAVLWPLSLQSLKHPQPGHGPKGQGLSFSCTPAVAAPWGAPVPQDGHQPHPRPTDRVTVALPVSLGPRRDRQGPAGRHEAVGREPGVARSGVLSGGSLEGCSGPASRGRKELSAVREACRLHLPMAGQEAL